MVLILYLINFVQICNYILRTSSNNVLTLLNGKFLILSILS